MTKYKKYIYVAVFVGLCVIIYLFNISALTYYNLDTLLNLDTGGGLLEECIINIKSSKYNEVILNVSDVEDYMLHCDFEEIKIIGGEFP